ncbi:MAG: hybrid sensor histidine kinase/response regulator, partial [Leptolyngbya sp. SIO1D8]|nr:hybrid sensor histidine kinase/response regulator [Leptolyngbya sp. SIO1D8]
MMIEDEELQSLYHATGTERLQRLEAGLLNLEQQPNDPEILNALQQEIHGLKGDSKSVGLESITTVAERIEEILHAIQQQRVEFTMEVSDRLYQGLQVTGQLVHEAVTGEPSDVDSEEIRYLLEAVLPPTTPFSEQEAIATSPEMPSTDIYSTDIYIKDDELREIYRTTSEGRLQTLFAHLSQLEKNPTDELTLEVLRRETHSLKGDSNAVGLGVVAELTQSVEDIIKNIQGQSLPLTDKVSTGLQQGLTTISQLVQEAVSGQPSGVDIDAETERLITVTTPAAIASPTVSPVVEKVTPPVVGAIADAELREIYRTTSEERLQQLEASLLYLEKHPYDEATLATLMREAHSLKGDSRSAGVDSVEALAHALEDVLTKVQSQDIEFGSTVSDRLYQGLDAIGLLVQEAVTGAPAHIPIEQLLHDLRAAIAAPTPTENALLLNPTQLLPPMVREET